MLLANMAVAHRLQKAFPRLALLRRHPSPKLNKAEDLVKFLISITEFLISQLFIYPIEKHALLSWSGHKH